MAKKKKTTFNRAVVKLETEEVIEKEEVKEVYAIKDANRLRLRLQEDTLDGAGRVHLPH